VVGAKGFEPSTSWSRTRLIAIGLILFFIFVKLFSRLLERRYFSSAHRYKYGGGSVGRPGGTVGKFHFSDKR
jgi:hypothetical protein